MTEEERDALYWARIDTGLTGVLMKHRPVSAGARRVTCSCDGKRREHPMHAIHIADAVKEYMT